MTSPPATTPFDTNAEEYRGEVQASIDFLGQEHAYFTRRKAEWLAAILERCCGDLASLSVLDVGCGIGSTDGFVEQTFRSLIGVDPSAEAVRRAGGANPSAAYAAASGLRLPLRDHAVDAAFAVNVLHHVEPPDRDRFIAEVVRVVRPGGLVIVFEHNPLNPLTRLSVARCEFDEGVELLGARELRTRFATAGLAPVENNYIIFTPFDSTWQHRVEERLGRVPLGAQHYLAGRVST